MTTSPHLPRFGDFTVKTAGTDLNRWAQEVEKLLPEPWSRAPEREESLRGETPPVVFERPDDEHGRVRVWVFASPTALQVKNIAADGTGQLTPEQYNAILREFAEDGGEPAAEQLGVSCELDVAGYDLAKALGDEGFAALRGFSALANQSGVHPYDRERWNTFLVHAHRRGPGRPDAGRVGEWLGANGWDEESAYGLVIEYEHAMDLLDIRAVMA